MKKFNALLMSIFVLSTLYVSADIIYPDGTKSMPEPYALKKLSRGIANIIMFAFEIPLTSYKAADDNSITDPRVITDALTTGTYRAMKRLEAGVYDVGTFLDEDKKPKYHLDPEFINVFSLIPGSGHAFYWESIDTGSSAQQ